MNFVCNAVLQVGPASLCKCENRIAEIQTKKVESDIETYAAIPTAIGMAPMNMPSSVKYMRLKAGGRKGVWMLQCFDGGRSAVTHGAYATILTFQVPRA